MLVDGDESLLAELDNFKAGRADRGVVASKINGNRQASGEARRLQNSTPPSPHHLSGLQPLLMCICTATGGKLTGQILEREIVDWKRFKNRRQVASVECLPGNF
jgi:hypothetical protein